MVTARFYVLGDESSWLRARVQEEIHTHNLEGNVIGAGHGRLAVIIEGERKRILELYENLQQATPEDFAMTDITFSEYAASDRTARDLMFTNSMETLIELLREIEKNTRRINQKIDKVLRQKGGGADDTCSTYESADTGYSDGSSEEAADSFASMFGN
ncbi:MAG: hypothetical protein V1921_07280 [Candidatus Altiarchaeota archaeon]